MKTMRTILNPRSILGPRIKRIRKTTKCDGSGYWLINYYDEYDYEGGYTQYRRDCKGCSNCRKIVPYELLDKNERLLSVQS